MLEHCPLARATEGGPCWFCSVYDGDVICGNMTNDNLVSNVDICPRDNALLARNRCQERWLREKYRDHGIEKKNWTTGSGRGAGHAMNYEMPGYGATYLGQKL